MELKPSRELDRLIEEKVFCREVSDHKFANGPAYFDPPAYSTDINAAWTLVQKLSMCVAEAGAIDSEGCTFSHHTAICSGQRGEVIYRWGESVPHAICLAALKALGIKF